MKVGLAQINSTVGDLQGNTQRILSAYHEAVSKGADLVITPELAITGYPPQDLVFKSRFVPLNLEALDKLEAEIDPRVPLLVGFVDPNTGRGNPFFNAAALLQKGAPRRIVHKTLLPTYDVFDEDRYFQPERTRRALPVAGQMAGITICEDIWPPEYLHRPLYDIDPVVELAAGAASCILNLSASPYHAGKPKQRVTMLSKLAKHSRVPIVYCNSVGGNDQLVFDGHSVVVNAEGQVLAVLPGFEESVQVVDLDGPPMESEPHFATEPEEIYNALRLGLRDYMRKCGFKTAVLGLSGGIDSALTAVIAADAIGAENVTGVTMPARYSSTGSVEDSRILAERLGIKFLNIPIESSFKAMIGQLEQSGMTPQGVTEENLQPRLRGLTLMALSNQFGHLVLTTGNKSELAVGYCTLYGDMCGGLAVISDLPKTTVYEVSRWINREREIIPSDTITKPPSAELRPDQKDQDTLPPYDVLDAILKLYIEEQVSAHDIVQRGLFDEATVRWVQRRVDLNEYKRAQAAPGLRVTSKAFGAGRRMPIAQRFVD